MDNTNLIHHLPADILTFTTTKLLPCDLVILSRVSHFMHALAAQQQTFQVVSNIYHHKYTVTSVPVTAASNWVCYWSRTQTETIFKDNVEKLLFRGVEEDGKVTYFASRSTPGKVVEVKAEIDPNTGVVEENQVELDKKELIQELDLYKNKFYRIEKKSTATSVNQSELYLHDNPFVFSTRRVCFFPSHYIIVDFSTRRLTFYAIDQTKKNKLNKITTISGFSFNSATPSATGEKLMGLEVKDVPPHSLLQFDPNVVTVVNFMPEAPKELFETTREKISSFFKKLF